MRLKRIGAPTLVLALIAAAVCVAPISLFVYALLKDTFGNASDVVMAAFRTVGIMLLGGALSIAVGLAAALYIFYVFPPRWRSMADTALFCMAGISPTVFAMLTLILWQERGLTFASLLFAVVLSSCGFSARYMLQAFSRVPPALLDSARALGLTGMQSMRRVLIPSARRGLAGTALHTMARIGALATVLNMIGRQTYLTGLLISGDGGLIAPALLLAALCVGCYIAGSRIRRRGHA